MPLSPNELINAGVTRSLISAEQMESVRLEAMRQRKPLVEMAAHEARCPVAMLYCALAEERGLPFVDLSKMTIDQELIRKIPAALLRARLILPIADEGNEVLVATADPDDVVSLRNIERILARPVRVALTDPDSLRETIRHLLSGRSKTQRDEASDPIEVCERILDQAYLRRASDVHLESEPDGLRVRLRIDGRLQNFPTRIGSELGTSVISRIKVLAGLDIAEQRAPQDGRYQFTPLGRDGSSIDIRVATIPTRHGERVTMRLLDSSSHNLSLESIGMSKQSLVRFRRIIQQPNGIVLMAGPTGSGKTSTLYAALRELNELHRNIMTVENPVEYVMPGISQVAIGETEKLTFAKALRSLLRHDPDVLMVGEIRDIETAEVAMQAAMTGHFVFSTIHVNSAAGAVTRLVEMGCPPYLVASTLRGVISQRLVRRLCETCKKSRPATIRESKLLGVPETELRTPSGCARCMGAGYRGRIGVFETLWIDSAIRKLIHNQASEDEIETQAGRQLEYLCDDARSKVLAGVTTIEEMQSIIDAEYDDDDFEDETEEDETMHQVDELRRDVADALAAGQFASRSVESAVT